MTFPKRKPARLRGHHYGVSGAYFLTICIDKRSNILSDIVFDTDSSKVECMATVRLSK